VKTRRTETRVAAKRQFLPATPMEIRADSLSEQAYAVIRQFGSRYASNVIFAKDVSFEHAGRFQHDAPGTSSPAGGRLVMSDITPVIQVAQISHFLRDFRIRNAIVLCHFPLDHIGHVFLG